ncbi:unnamed protein product [Allacma fusca]|uniref:Uncharacterized protein n=1 Tax=Allacma fusca TaxID=39272 RepID=A0A8J2LEV3_9HEXA|nr:unnamed protein product [Allacma fusca]
MSLPFRNFKLSSHENATFNDVCHTSGTIRNFGAFYFDLYIIIVIYVFFLDMASSIIYVGVLRKHSSHWMSKSFIWSKISSVTYTSG